MTRVQEIIQRVRDSLADEHGKKFSDAQLLRLLDEGQKDLCKRAKLLRTETEIQVIRGQAVYELPEDLLLLDSAYLNDHKSLEFIGHHEMDKREPRWRDREGDPTLVIYDKQEKGVVTLYPKPVSTGNIAFRVEPAVKVLTQEKIRRDFGVVSAVASPSEVKQDFGIAVSIDSRWEIHEPGEIPQIVMSPYKFFRTEGVVTSVALKSKGEIRNPAWGLVTGMDGVLHNNSPWGLWTSFSEGRFAEVRYGDVYGVATEFFPSEEMTTVTMFKDTGLVSTILGTHQDSDFGLVTDASQLAELNVQWENRFGIPSGAYAHIDKLTLLYIRKPKTIDSLESEIELDNSLDDALKFYVAGSALIANIDAQNRQLGQELLGRYAALSQQAERSDATDFTRTEKVWFTNYDGGFTR